MVKPTYNLPSDPSDDPSAVQHWLGHIGQFYATEQQQSIADACTVLLGCFGDLQLETGESRARHLLCTADILVGLRMDADTVCAALLSNCLDHPAFSRQQLIERFGSDVEQMIESLDRIGYLINVEKIIAAHERQEHEENLRRLLLGIAEDMRVVLVVLAERVHLMRAIKRLPEPQRNRITRDTERIYAPLANRLGVWQIKWELEDLTLRYLQPHEYNRIAGLLAERREQREAYIEEAIEILRQHFERAGIEARISGRPKHIYSIWRKMQRKNVGFDEIFDLRAVRIMVDSIADCYAALGIVHGLWRHIPHEFDDYIATPKGNMYQSLHTAVIGPRDKSLEIQIRTPEMHRHAELGVAAHWAYKEAKSHDAEFQRRITWMRNWLELKKDGGNSGDFFERFKTEFEPIHVYVLTPRAKVIELPRGSTPLDFAYAIHSEIGNTCRGARVNRRIVPLNRRLRSGDTVEILTQKNAEPSRDWLSPHHGYLHTARARNRVRQWFKQKDFERNLQHGRSVLERELGRLGISERPDLASIAPQFNFKSADDLLAAIGAGDVTAGQAIRRGGLAPEAPPQPESAPLTERARGEHRESGPFGDVIVQGVDDLMTQIAQCCKPVPHDDIVGFITRGRGVSVHRKSCKNLQHLAMEERERLIEVHWADQAGERTYAAELIVIALDRKGLLRDISSLVMEEDVDLIGVNTHSERSTATASMRFTVEVSAIERLEHLLNRLRQLPEVLDVSRSG